MDHSEPLSSRLLDLGFKATTPDGTEVIEAPVCRVLAGAFAMGSDPQSMHQGRVTAYELPQHLVDLAAFEMTRFPITVAEYARAVSAGAVPAPPLLIWDDESILWERQQDHPDHPVVNVSWSDARRYAQWLSHLTSLDWRLPSEAEWEKAARGTDGRVFPWGNEWDGRRANTADGGLGSIAPIGAYPQGVSPYGIEDLAGNVYEWCNSRFAPYPYHSDDGRENGQDQFGRVMRGGCWSVDLWHARATGRNANDEPFDAFPYTGFRLVRSEA